MKHIVSAALLILALSSSSASAVAPKTGKGIARVWHGQVENAKADEYSSYLSDAVKKFKTINGNRGYMIFRQKGRSNTDFMVISYWDSKKSIEAYAGKDISQTHFLPRDPEFLIDPEKTVKNYEVEDVVFDAPTLNAECKVR